MAAPTTGGDGEGNDDEEAPHYPPREICISGGGGHHHNAAFNCDDDTQPSELSTLLQPSTLTNYDRDMVGLTPVDSHSGSHPSSVWSHKLFQFVALLGFLLLGAMFGADAVYMWLTKSDDMSRFDSSAMRPNSNGEYLDGARDGAQLKVSKKTKAGKKHKRKPKEALVDTDFDSGDDEYGDEDGEYEFDDDHVGDNQVGAADDDELIVTTTQREVHQPSLTPDQIATATDRGEEEGSTEVAIPMAHERCAYVIDTFEEQNADVTNMDFLKDKYVHQSTDPNVFYRATALLFWKDFAAGYWGADQGRRVDFKDMVNLREARYEDGTPLSRMSTWTWITGDQHLSNFGAWRNRGGEVVFGVNDFDEAAIFDFHIDVLRVAISICSHGFTNGFSTEDVKEALEAFTYTYVKTAVDYVGGDASLTYELNPRTSTGVLRDFLEDVADNKSRINMMHKFTEIGDDGVRRFIRDDHTRLEDVPAEIEAKIRAEMTVERYGATLMKMGWKIRSWDDDFFTVLDIARRTGSGVGSFGVDRFYVLLKGEDMSLEEDEDGASVILDVKYEPESAVSRILNDGNPLRHEWLAWYNEMFAYEAVRTGQAQRRLTSYTDPYVGYLVIDGDSYNVRQRSPYKSSFDYSTLTNHRAFSEFMEQVAVATATAHVRGTVSKSPGQFKHVIKLLLAGDRNRRRWSDLVAKIALSYREQVLLDFACFKQYVRKFTSN